MDSPTRPRFPSRFTVLLVIVVLLFVFGNSFFQIYADWLWFVHDAQQPEVFSKTLGTRVLLWSLGVVVTVAAVFLNARVALRMEAIYEHAPADENARAAANVLGIVQRFGRVLALVVAVVFGIGIGTTLAGAYRELWAFQHAVPFGKQDPLFGLDLGFFVFKLPWYSVLVNTLLSVLFMTTLVVVLTYLGTRGLAKVARVHLVQGPMRAHLSSLIGATMLVYGVRLYLAQYSLGTHESQQFVGPGYAQSQVVGFYGFLALVVVLVGAATIANGWVWKPWRAPIGGAIVFLVLSIVLLGIYPAMVQQYKVEPNLLTLEPPFAQRAIESTRYAYGLDKFEVRDFNVRAAPTAEEVAAASTTLQSMRLWDPDVLRRVFEERQTLRSYYHFFDVDVDRYTVEGIERMVMLAPRDIRNSGLDPKDQNWQNQHLRYTHGFGIVAAPANETINEGEPNYWLSNFPPQQGNVIPISEQRMYFSHFPAGSLERDSYVLLNTDLAEFDYPADPEALHNWKGTRGIPISSALPKFVFSSLFGEIKFYTTGDIKPETRMIYRRDIVDRASRVYPFLEFDYDPYVVVADGRTYWILDAYTVTDKIPYSDFTGDINYIRNSVKIVIDAYNGDMDAYAVDEDEPILKTWRGVFPGLVHPVSEVPTSIREHFRYAEGLFIAQSTAMARYHVKDSRQFLSNEDAWQVALEKTNPDVQIEPYYVQMRVPGEEKDGFMLIRPFSTRTKNNMIGWMAAFCDPEDYGRVVVFKFPRDTQTQGPAQMDAKFAADPIVADINRQFNNEQSSIVPGNLLVIPIGSSVLYVKPLFLESKSRPIPELRKVVLGLQNRVVVADTYDQALARLFTGRQEPVPREAQVEQPGSTDAAEIQAISRLLDQADAALRNGDFARYGELQKEARERLKRLGQ